MGVFFHAPAAKDSAWKSGAVFVFQDKQDKKEVID